MMTEALTVPAGRAILLDRSVSCQFLTPLPVRFLEQLPIEAPWGTAWIKAEQITASGGRGRVRELLVLVDAFKTAAAVGLHVASVSPPGELAARRAQRAASPRPPQANTMPRQLRTKPKMAVAA